MQQTSVNSTFLGIPLNRIVAFVGPYVSVVSGALAAWLLTHLHVLSTFHLSNGQLATGITQLTVFAITAGLTWLGHQKWLTGHQIELESGLRAAAAPIASGHNGAPATNGTAPRQRAGA